MPRLASNKPPVVASMPLDLTVHGRTGLKQYGGILAEELHLKLQGTQATKVYMEMRDNNAVIGAFLFAIKMLMRHAEWTVESYNDSTEAENDAVFLRECIDDLEHTWEDFISEIMSMLVFGHSFFEICYWRRDGTNSKFDDGRVGWKKLEIRAQETLDHWEFDQKTGDLLGMWQNAPPDFVPRYIPIEKALLFRTEVSKNNPSGYSVLRTAYPSYYMLKRIQTLEAIGCERDLAGIPVLEVPPRLLSSAATATEKATLARLQTAISEIRRDEREGLIIPSELDTEGKPTGWKFYLTNSGGQRQIDTDKIIRRYEQRIATTVLADFILLGLDKVGSFALASSKTNLFAIVIGTWMKSIAATVNRQAIPRLFRLNGLTRKNYPRIVPGDLEKIPLDEFGTFLSSLAKTGLLTPGRALERKIRQVADLPDPEEDEDELMATGLLPAKDDIEPMTGSGTGATGS